MSPASSALASAALRSPLRPCTRRRTIGRWRSARAAAGPCRRALVSAPTAAPPLPHLPRRARSASWPPSCSPISSARPSSPTSRTPSGRGRGSTGSTTRWRRRSPTPGHGREVRRRRRHGGLRRAGGTGGPRGARAPRRAVDAEAAHELFGDALALRIGVNTGEVVVGQPREGSSFVTGDAVNVAARLEQAAAPGEILVGRRTAAAVRGAFELDEPRTVEAKGKPGGVRLPRARPCAVADAAARRRRPAPRLRRPASASWSCCRRRFARAVDDGEPQLVTMIGEAGVGKTTLVRELWEWLATVRPNRFGASAVARRTAAGRPTCRSGRSCAEHLGLLESDPPRPSAAGSASARSWA